MAGVELKREDGIAYREAVPEEERGLPVLCLHGWPQSSYMWRHLLADIAAAGRRAVAPDFRGFGDSSPDLPGTVERQVEWLDRFRLAAGLDRVVLAVHDTGGGLGFFWAFAHPDAVGGLVITNTGFFPDYEWHEIAVAMRTPGQGEALVDSLSRDALATLLQSASQGIDAAAVDEYWKAFATPENRRSMLDLYRSFDLDRLEPYQGRFHEFGVPALVLWGGQDDFIPREYPERFASRIPGARLQMLEDVGHFLFEDAPERCNAAVTAFLREAAP